MNKIENLKNGKNYIAIGTDGNEYEGTAKYFEKLGMIFFTCVPEGVDLIDFKEVKEK